MDDKKHPLSFEFYLECEEIVRIAKAGARKAQEESRRLGVPNVYSINGFLYYELPNGELSREGPYQGPVGK